MRARMIALGVAALIGSAASAHAFCGFYVGGAGAKMFNNATEVVLMRHGTTTVLSMQNNYQGPPEKFALVVPVPTVIKESQVKTLPREVFTKVDVLGAPRLVEYWEADPCNPYVDDESGAEVMRVTSTNEDDEDGEREEKEYKVKIEAKFSVGEYDIVVLSAQDSTGLERWLTANKYEIPSGAAPLLRPYIEEGMKFFVAKVDPKKVTFSGGMATLSPLRFFYDSADLRLPIRLGLANANGPQDLIVNILAPNQRYEVANRPNVTIPTNLTVKDEVRTRFGEFYAALFDHTLREVPNAVVTEYSWDSGSCDPCPGPTLDSTDVGTLGGDVIGATYKDAQYTSYTLTRLHARYGSDIKDDLVFRAVNPIMGGRGIPEPTGAMDAQVVAGGVNNFQGRYVILHPWTGAVACAAPVRGRWGGPPDGQQIAVPATNTAFAPRGKLELASMVSTTLSVSPLSSEGATLPIPVRGARGCGCQTQGGAASAFGVAAVGFLVLRRRRRRS